LWKSCFKGVKLDDARFSRCMIKNQERADSFQKMFEVDRKGKVSLAINLSKDFPLTEPIVSMSRTVLNALAERPEMGEIKFPAAPALKGEVLVGNLIIAGGDVFSHDIVNSSQFLNASLNSSL
jgi:hypothetical protein